MFKAGDIVTVVNKKSSFHGKNGTIQSVDRNDMYFPYYIRLAGKEAEIPFSERELTLAQVDR